MSPQIHVGLIGFGLAGRCFHAPVIDSVPGLKVTAILKREPPGAGNLWPGARYVPTLAEMLRDDSIRLVVVATPNTSHFSYAKEALLAGRDVVVDKPFTITSGEARELCEIARSGKRQLSVYHIRRWDGDFATVAELIRSGTLGRLVSFESRYDRFRPELKPGAWREQAGPGNGVFFDLGPHLIDQAMALFGWPQEVWADIRSERGGDADDAFDLHFAYPGLTVKLGSSMLAATPGPHFRLLGTRGSFTKFGMDPQEERLRAGEMPNAPDWGKEPEERWGTLTVAQGEWLVERKVPSADGDYRGFYDNVRQAVLGEARLAVTGEDGLRVMLLLESCVESAKKRCAVTPHEK